MANDVAVYKRKAAIYTLYLSKHTVMDFDYTQTALLGGIMIGVLLVVLVPAIFYLLTLQKTLGVISPESRMMQPAQVWLLLIPLFNIVWQFIVVNRVADSIKNECIRLNIPTQEARPTYSIGISMCVLYICGIVPLVGSFASIAGIVCWILYWVKVNNYKNIIITNRDNFLLDAEREAMQTPLQ